VKEAVEPRQKLSTTESNNQLGIEIFDQLSDRGRRSTQAPPCNGGVPLTPYFSKKTAQRSMSFSKKYGKSIDN